MRSLIIYWSKTGNTAKVADRIQHTLVEQGATADLLTVTEAQDLDWFDYDLVCLGFPSHGWQPPKPVSDYLTRRFAAYRQKGLIKLGAPRCPGTQAIVFCTYSGPHTGLAEAIPAGKYAQQFFDHVGITVLDEIYVVGEFHGSEELSTQGYLGDTRGRPNEADLAVVARRISQLIPQASGTPE